MYLMTGTRPDLAFAIRTLSQHLEKPKWTHWTAAKRVLRYLSGARTHGILYDGKLEGDLRGFCDADWAGCKESRLSQEVMYFSLPVVR